MRTRRALPLFAAFIVTLAVATPRHADAIFVFSGAINDMPPPNDPGFYNVGLLADGGVGSAIYLGNQWVLSAAHVGAPNAVVFRGDSYEVVAGSARYLSPIAGISKAPDLVLYRVSTVPTDLPDLQISPTRSVIGDRMLMMGHGQVNGGRDSLGNPALLPTTAIHWGENVVSQTLPVFTTPGFPWSYPTCFANSDMATGSVTPLPSEAAATVGDSGGAVFIRGRLAGVMTVSTGFAQLAPYRDQIVVMTGVGVLGDTNADRAVDGVDLTNVVSHFGQQAPLFPIYPTGDTNYDGVVDLTDYNHVFKNLGRSSSDPLPGDTDGNRLVNMEDFSNVVNNFGRGNGVDPIVGDTNGDHRVDLQDSANVMRYLGTFGTPGQILGDTNGDGRVDMQDYANVFNNYGAAIQELLGDTNGDNVVNEIDLANVLRHLGPQAVPEPAACVLLGLGGLSLIAVARRRGVRSDDAR